MCLRVRGRAPSLGAASLLGAEGGFDGVSGSGNDECGRSLNDWVGFHYPPFLLKTAGDKLLIK